ncbi:MAG TPA: hypothetical protein VLG48_06330 [Candidatus Methylomirabilis sp.]|nr:hypothetical protein [Candidatus Methylomirabilis sp.]
MATADLKITRVRDLKRKIPQITRDVRRLIHPALESVRSIMAGLRKTKTPKRSCWNRDLAISVNATLKGMRHPIRLANTFLEALNAVRPPPSVYPVRKLKKAAVAKKQPDQANTNPSRLRLSRVVKF